MLLLLLSLACAPDPDAYSGGAAASADTDWSQAGPWAAGTRPFSVSVAGRDAPIAARAWYPAAGTPADTPLPDLVEDDVEAGILADLLAGAPAGCPSRSLRVLPDGEPANLAPATLLVYSHCHDCLGLSGATVAATLASHGFVVVVPDHEGNTVFDALAGEGGALTEAWLAQRAADASATLDAALSGAALPAGVAVNPDQVGALGHSFGAVTTGRLLRDDARVRAGLAMGAPIDNPLLAGVDAETVTQQVLLLLLEEDNSIGALGNQLIEGNYAALAGPAWLARMPDGGHWSVSDLCGLVEGFMPGCGQGERQTGGAPFTYVSPDAGRSAAASLSAAFFAATLQDQGGARRFLDQPQGGAALIVSSR